MIAIINCLNYYIWFYIQYMQAQSAAVAEIWLWQVGSWKAVGRLQSHSLTVTHIEFSYDDSFLLAVSRDRQFSVFSIKKSGAYILTHILLIILKHILLIFLCYSTKLDLKMSTMKSFWRGTVSGVATLVIQVIGNNFAIGVQFT